MRNLNYAWAAGLFEGEGCVSLFKDRRSPTRVVVSVMLNSTDNDVLVGLQRIAGGTIAGPYTSKVRKNAKRFWTWQIGKADKAYEFLLNILPYMGERRKARIEEALVVLRTRDAIKPFID